MSAKRNNQGKVKLSHILDAPLAVAGYCVRAELGAMKYTRNNWKSGFETSELIDSLLRHLMAYQNGETIDPEDGGYHVDAVMWNATVLSEQFHKERLKNE